MKEPIICQFGTHVNKLRVAGGTYSRHSLCKYQSREASANVSGSGLELTENSGTHQKLWKSKTVELVK